MSAKVQLPVGGTHRRSDLRRVLLEHGVALARAGGPRAIVLRETTRRAGVVPNAAYRHFRNHQALFEAVRAVALSRLARTIEVEIDAAQSLQDPRQHARAALRGVGLGYLRFAREEPGLFRTAFAARPFQVGETVAERDSPCGTSGLGPFELLGGALDGMVDAGLLPVAQRPGAEWMAWSAVHGLALLALDGPLRGLGEDEYRKLATRLVTLVEQGLSSAPRPTTATAADPDAHS